MLRRRQRSRHKCGAPWTKTIVTATTTSTLTSNSSPQRPRPREPSSQNITEREPSAESEAKIKNEVTADKAHPTAIPAMRSRTEVNLPAERAMKNITADATSAPIKAALCKTSAKPAPTPKKMASAAPVLAPELMPKIYGSAKAFRTIACKIAPATARPAPTAAPKIRRGIRMSQITAFAEDAEAGTSAPKILCAKAMRTSDKLIGVGPIIMPQAKTPTSKNTSNIDQIVVRRACALKPRTSESALPTLLVLSGSAFSRCTSSCEAS